MGSGLVTLSQFDETIEAEVKPNESIVCKSSECSASLFDKSLSEMFTTNLRYKYYQCMYVFGMILSLGSSVLIYPLETKCVII